MASFVSKILHKDVTGERLREYPELKEFPDDRRRHKAYNAAIKEVAKRHHFPLLARLAFFGFCILGFTAMSTFRAPDMFMKRTAAVALCVYILLELWIYRWAIPRVRRELRRMLDKHASCCRQCDYALVGNTSGRCPECGTLIPPDQLRLISTRSDLGLEIEPTLGVEC